MATIRQRSSGNWEIIIRRKGLLAKPHSATADSEALAHAYAKRIETFLDQGIIPVELQKSADPENKTVWDWAKIYFAANSISSSDKKLLNQLCTMMQSWPISDINHDWADNWIDHMTRVDNLTPITIRHKVGAVARLLDWCLRKELINKNPLRNLPTKYSNYAENDPNKKVNEERERRLEKGEYEKIMKILDGEKPAHSQRGIKEKDRSDWRLLFILATETGMRLREMYTITIDQIDLPNKTIFLDRTKNGDKRQVPLSSIAVNAIKNWNNKTEQLFPWWDGDLSIKALEKLTSKLSRKWNTIARLAKCDDLHFHDLRHEATCRFFERTNLRETEIAKITGHKDLRMLKRYANLRASDLANALW